MNITSFVGWHCWETGTITYTVRWYGSHLRLLNRWSNLQNGRRDQRDLHVVPHHKQDVLLPHPFYLSLFDGDGTLQEVIRFTTFCLQHDFIILVSKWVLYRHGYRTYNDILGLHCKLKIARNYTVTPVVAPLCSSGGSIVLQWWLHCAPVFPRTQKLQEIRTNMHIMMKK